MSKERAHALEQAIGVLRACYNRDDAERELLKLRALEYASEMPRRLRIVCCVCDEEWTAGHDCTTTTTVTTGGGGIAPGTHE
jgi:hypothetical protein